MDKQGKLSGGIEFGRKEPRMAVLKRGTIPHSGYMEWFLIESATPALTEEQGLHLILTIPKNESDPEGACYLRKELTDDKRAYLGLMADKIGEELATKLGNEEYYRVSLNGMKASKRPGLHYHIYVAKKGIKFLRCVDPGSILEPKTA